MGNNYQTLLLTVTESILIDILKQERNVVHRLPRNRSGRTLRNKLNIDCDTTDLICVLNNKSESYTATFHHPLNNRILAALTL